MTIGLIYRINTVKTDYKNTILIICCSCGWFPGLCLLSCSTSSVILQGPELQCLLKFKEDLS